MQPRLLGRQHSNVDVGVWPIGSQDEFPRVPRARRLRRQLLGYRSDIVWSLLTFLCLAWMTLIALTLWH